MGKDPEKTSNNDKQNSKLNQFANTLREETFDPAAAKKHEKK